MTLVALSAAQARAAIAAGARLIDIRDADEHARERIAGAVNVPLDRIDDVPRDACAVVFHCRSGMRTDAHGARLAAAAGDVPAYMLSGGIEAWRRAGQGTVVDRSPPLEIMRQVQIAAGALVLAGVVLGVLAGPGFLALSGFVGAGLMFAGVTGWCGMARLLRVLPWNRRAAS